MKVLVVAPAWVGDMVMAQPLASTLASRGATVHFLAPPATAELALRLPDVASVHVAPGRHGHLDYPARLATARRLRPLGFDQAVVLPNSWKSALIPWLAGIPRRSGWRGEFRFGLLNDIRRLDAGRWPRTVDRFLTLAVPNLSESPELRAPAVAVRPRLHINPERRARLAAQHGLRTDRPVVALCPGAEFGAAKRWPAQRFAELARHCDQAGTSVWLFGGSADAAAADAIAADSNAVSLAGKTRLPDAVDLLSLASAAVCNDSGLMHVASALDVPTVAIYGSTSPERTPPLSPRSAIVRHNLACQPCFARECPLGHRRCLTGISAAEVWARLRSLLDQPAAIPRRTRAEA